MADVDDAEAGVEWARPWPASWRRLGAPRRQGGPFPRRCGRGCVGMIAAGARAAAQGEVLPLGVIGVAVDREHEVAFAGGEHHAVDAAFACRDADGAVAAAELEALEVALAVVEQPTDAAADADIGMSVAIAGPAVGPAGVAGRRRHGVVGVASEPPDAVSELAQIAGEHRLPAVARRDRRGDVA